MAKINSACVKKVKGYSDFLLFLPES